IDLLLTNEKQLGGMTKGHKYDIRKARKLGISIVEDKSFRQIDEFMQIYNETMERNAASANYFFPKEYYIELKKSFGESIKLFFAMLEDQAVSASMFFMTGRIIQYHLSGTRTEHLYLNGAKLIIDEIRLWGVQNGFSWLHLGGGVGSSEDSLFRFKAGFSKLRQPFQVVRKIANQEIYTELCSQRKKWAKVNGYTLSESNFFPEYRRLMQPRSHS
ncbi:MAG: peptidoglycan bridge formation glycyltransferase FemA/FemB family protein, partial [Desulfobacterales bacterium]|nr:peptidoglycan bridge formation glycyltransferase FemA/FemB family protein [Desulfobacterales bacterium]